MTKEKHWCAVHTRPGAEKKVSRLLQKKKIENYCPFTSVAHKMPAKKQGAIVPLFPCCVFVHAYSEEHNSVMQTDGIVNFLFWLSRPAIIKSEEIAALRYYVNDNYNITVQKTQVNRKEPFNVANCLFTGVGEDGLLVNENYTKIYLPSLGYSVCALSSNKAQAVRALDKFEATFKCRRI